MLTLRKKIKSIGGRGCLLALRFIRGQRSFSGKVAQEVEEEVAPGRTTKE